MLNRAERQNCPSVPHAEATGLGRELYDLIAELYPICRSITGNGVRETLRVLAQRIPLEVREIPSGTQVFDWTVPKEWNIRDAYIEDSSGRKIVDFKRSNLHVLSYSSPVKKTLSLAQLKEHLFTTPQYPDWIPYRTSYYNDNWGFCLSHSQYESLLEDDYEVVIDSSLEDGYLTLGECYVEGETKDEILISTHICHPSLANDNLSGIAVATFLARALLKQRRRYSYRFLFVPGTIGPIAWIALNEGKIARVRHGLVVACVGDSGSMTYKKSRIGEAEIDKAVEHVLKHSGDAYEVGNFSPYGYDERQYCSPGINLPMGCLMRTPHGRYPEYHTSADDLEFVRPESLADSLAKYLAVFEVLDKNRKYLNQHPKCEPQLGKRGLYASTGGHSEGRTLELALLWVLNFSDGSHSLLDIAERSSLPFALINNAAHALLDHGLLREC
jgi:aminopeptidase-like protein